jgi:hypothetical protein
MREIRTSGSMSGDGKRSVAAWPKLPRPSSTLPKLPKPTRQACPQLAEADVRSIGKGAGLTQGGGKPARYFAAQQAPDLKVANPLSCHPG